LGRKTKADIKTENAPTLGLANAGQKHNLDVR
jgi:hypothetical protein